MLTTGNKLLDVLPEETRSLVWSTGKVVDLPSRAQLHHSQELPKHLYFILGGVASLVVHMSQGGSVEVGMTGREGVVSAVSLLGPAPTQVEAFMQVAGSGLRVPMARMHQMFEENEDLRMRILQFQQAQANIASQIAACNKLHEADARLARWLLTAADLSGLETLPLTQEYLAEMLGSQRTTVAVIAGGLQRRGLISYQRGTVQISDRAGLTEAACDCYGVTRSIVEKLYF